MPERERRKSSIPRPSVLSEDYKRMRKEQMANKIAEEQEEARRNEPIAARTADFEFMFQNEIARKKAMEQKAVEQQSPPIQDDYGVVDALTDPEFWKSVPQGFKEMWDNVQAWWRSNQLSHIISEKSQRWERERPERERREADRKFKELNRAGKVPFPANFP